MLKMKLSTIHTPSYSLYSFVILVYKLQDFLKINYLAWSFKTDQTLFSLFLYIYIYTV